MMLVPVALSAQRGGGTPAARGVERKGNIKALKIAFITNRLALTSQEAQGFWPIYNEKQAKLQALVQQRRELLKQARDGYYSMTDADMEKNIKQVFNVLQQELDLEKTYYEAFKAALPIKKIALLYKVEKDFKREVLKEALTRAEEE